MCEGVGIRDPECGIAQFGSRIPDYPFTPRIPTTE